MSDRSEAPVTPVEAYEPPYYVAVFTTVRSQEQSGYSETNARMEDLVKDTSATPTPSPSGGPTGVTSVIVPENVYC
ncbi:hypothetical protein [Streptomyces sp. NBC_00554]|uniref:hypothetical protein n=1 Tax=Streptomyces sp. NBC_00554 TaxID=2903661 RepID=UPI00352E3582